MKREGGGLAAAGGVPVRGGGGAGTARLLLWLVVAVLGIRQLVALLRLPPGERFLDLEAWAAFGGVARPPGELYADGAFSGTPFAALVLSPLKRAGEQGLGLGWTFGTLLLVVAVGVVAARALPRPVQGRTVLPAVPVAVALLLLSLPVRNTFFLGQTSVLPVLLVLLGCCVARDPRARGALIGVAAAFQPALLLFAVLLWCTGHRRAAGWTGGVFAAAAALAWAALPGDSAVYWLQHPAGLGLADPAAVANQSLHGAILRLGLSGPLALLVLLGAAGAVCYFGLRRAVRYAGDGQLLLAVALTGCVAVAVAPVSWQHQLLWVLLTVAGRAGRRASDRYVWPVAVVLVMTLPAKMLLPNMELLFPVRDNILLVTAVAAACCVPFLGRGQEEFARPRPTVHAPPGPSKLSWVPLLPFWRRVLTRPNLLLELLLIRVGYSAYSQVRMAAAGSRGTAEAHGEQIHAIEQALFLDIEHWVNHAVVRTGRLEEFLNFYYTSFHFVVPLTVLAVLYVRRPDAYRWARTALGFATLLALLGFWLYPLAPPRLMPELGFIDTVHGVQDFSRPDYGSLTAFTNQYAAMPSLHFGWSLWCGVVVVALAPKLWMRLLGLLHPFFTVCAIVGTANHWVLDAVGGAAVVAAGFGLVHVLAGPRPRRRTGADSPAEAGSSAEAVEHAEAIPLREGEAGASPSEAAGEGERVPSPG
ncbi:bifunctional glycosyltransferase 87/phosphatase PAP2 family protein [Streptomyces sp. NPDC058374]|uniref:bifunctional glycosyltransferase 87/phosphatase PAP2 family protein n=1 Tax=unclassified Streptomyces TaxID=2593676 RepID=UPI0036474F95